MADTQRSITAVLALLADNNTQQISAQDIRDVVETLRNGHGQIYVSSSAETTIVTKSVFVKAAGTTTLTTSPAAVGWSMSANNRLRYDGTADRIAHVTCAISLQAAANSKEIQWRLAKNGTTIADTTITRKIVVNSENGAAAITAIVGVSSGDYIELWVANDTDNTNATLSKMILTVVDHAL